MHRVLRQIPPAFLLLWPLSTPIHARQPERITIEAHATPTPFPHFWEQIFDSGRATLTLRENYRKDIRSVYNFSTSAKLRDNRLTLELTPNTLLLIKVQP